MTHMSSTAYTTVFSRSVLMMFMENVVSSFSPTLDKRYTKNYRQHNSP